MLAKIKSSAVIGLDAIPIDVEVDVASQGLPSFTIVGLPDKAVEESKERVRSAIKNSGAEFPAKRITVNLAPADIPKEGPSYDLPIALGILTASGQIEADFSDAIFLGELSLNGDLRRVAGVLPQAILARDKKLKSIFIPKDNSQEATVVGGIGVFGVESLLELFKHLKGEVLFEKEIFREVEISQLDDDYEFDFKDIKGQEFAKRALEIAAAGSHNVFLTGPPGAGKTLLSRALPSILPTLTFEEALEVTKIYSVAGLLKDGQPLIRRRSFRAPHNTASQVGLIGGGQHPKPGEISLSHKGVLFLDEIPLFGPATLEALRQPMEDGFITVSRARGMVTYPASFMLVCASNPCPCGFLGDPRKECRCTSREISRYQKRLSGPFLDRIDLFVEVPSLKIQKLEGEEAEPSVKIRTRVQKARDRQTERFKERKISANAEMSSRDIKEFVDLDPGAKKLLQQAGHKLDLSARGYSRVLRVGQTIADLFGESKIEARHIAEAVQYRQRLGD